MRDKLAGLKTDYTGAMSGRNRYRVLNHIGSIKSRYLTLNRLVGRSGVSETLERHFNNDITTEKAIRQLNKNEHRMPIRNSGLFDSVGLKKLIRRGHIEFHPCDVCNLRCRGCTYLQDTDEKPASVYFPSSGVRDLLDFFEPRAITLSGGGEPTLYQDEEYVLSDLVDSILSAKRGGVPELGLISNGTRISTNDMSWLNKFKWIRFSIDAGSKEIYKERKGIDGFESVLENLFRVLDNTNVPKVGLGFVYDSSNIEDSIGLLGVLASRVRTKPSSYLNRINIQFRPWQPPSGRHNITKYAITQNAYSLTGSRLLDWVGQDGFLKDFVKNNTNVAINLLCKGAHEDVSPFSHCFFGMAKSVIRADGSIYPCFRMAALGDAMFCFGNILKNSADTIALNQAYVLTRSVIERCVPDHVSCFLCLLNNIVEEGMMGNYQVYNSAHEDYFF